MHKNLITNADFNKDVKRKFDNYRQRMIAEAETVSQAEAKREQEALEEIQAAKAFKLA